MKNISKKYIVILFVLIVLMIIIGVIDYRNARNNDVQELLIGKDNINVNEKTITQISFDTINNNDVNSSDIDNVDNNHQNIHEIINDESDNKVNIENTSKEEIDNNNFVEIDVVEYFSDMEKEVSESSSFKEKFKEYFITVVDFIFYDKMVGGYTFNELSGSAKAKVIAIALKIDSKIEEYVPNYKESISSTSSRIYNNVKEKLVTLYMDIATDVCKNNNEECTKVKEIFGEIKSYCKIGWEFIKGLVSGGFTKLKEWYEIYSGK